MISPKRLNKIDKIFNHYLHKIYEFGPDFIIDILGERTIFDYILIHDYPIITVPLVDQRMGRIGKVSLQVNQEHGSLPAIVPVVPCQVLLEPAVVPVKALPKLAGPIVIDHARSIQRNQHLVA